MPKFIRLPNLTFPGLPQGKNEAQWNLKRLLYKGGAATLPRLVDLAILNGEFSTPPPNRVELLSLAHEVIAGKLAAGGSPETAKTQITNLRIFFQWADKADEVLSRSTVQAIYIRWTDYLVHRLHVEKSMSPHTAYKLGSIVGRVFDEVLCRVTPMIELTRLKEPKTRKTAQRARADKQHIESTFAFGGLLQDICDGMTLSAVWGPRPVIIPLRNGRTLVHRMGLHHKERVTAKKTPTEERKRLKKKAARQAFFEDDLSLDRRSQLVNLRILAEILMFIAQTGMNLSQANRLALRHFSYASDVDGYKVRDYKSRRGGEVQFEIFKDYRAHFERYLEWRKTLFPKDVRLFPLVRNNEAHVMSRPYFGLIHQSCKEAGVDWHPPSVLRGTRVNWLLRRSGDADLTAEMAQHHKQTLLSVYEIPSQQRSIGEITRFWKTADPTLSKSSPHIAVAPGACNGTPSALPIKPPMATSPDCIHPSGCLWCEHHRDIDSLDYVWALSCFRHLKILEVSKYHPAASAKHVEHPSAYAISRISEKLLWFRDSNATRRAWVDEALERIDEANYHPEWVRVIESVEGAQL